MLINIREFIKKIGHNRWVINNFLQNNARKIKIGLELKIFQRNKEWIGISTKCA